MKVTYSEYIDKSTDSLIDRLSSETISFDEKTAIIDSFADILINNVGTPDSLEDWELIFARESVLFIDKQISNLLTTPVATQKDFDNSFSFCNRQIELFKLFSDKRWTLPNIENKDLYKCVKEIEFKHDSQYVQTKLLSIDGTITSETSLAERTLSIDTCDSVLNKIAELEKTINYCKEKGIKIPKLKNSDLKKCKNHIESIRHRAEERNALYTKMYEVDTKMQSIDSIEKTVENDWIEAISLCEQQKKNKLQCEKNHWTIPVLRYTDTDSYVKKYQHYSSMVETDHKISEKKNSATESTRIFKQFSELCDTQTANLIICKDHRWSLPDLENPDPTEICEIVRKQKEKKDKIKNRKRNLISILIGIVIIASLSLFGYLKYIEGKIALPFSPSSVLGENYQNIVDELAKLGFKNIKKTSINTGFEKGDQIISVLVDGSDFYWEGKHYYPETAIEIKYTSSDRIDATALLSNWSSVSYNDLQNKLKGAGFTNIKTAKTVIYEKNKDLVVSSIKINDIEYKEGSCFIPKNASILITYYDFQIKISNSSSGFRDQDYNVVQKQLSSEGFTKISTKAITTGIGKGGTVSGISINGREDFRKNDVFTKDVPVIIYYYSNDRVDLSQILENWNEKQCGDLQKELKSAGFSNITIVPRKTSSSSKYNQIYGITLNDTQYKKGNCFLPKGSKISLECYKVVVTIGKDASAMRKKDYKQIVSDLKLKGFTNIRLERSDDLVTGWTNKPGTVKSISINGSKDFKSTDEFAIDSNVVIVVNTFEGKDYPDIIYKAK